MPSQRILAGRLLQTNTSRYIEKSFDADRWHYKKKTCKHEQIKRLIARLVYRCKSYLIVLKPIPTDTSIRMFHSILNLI